MTSLVSQSAVQDELTALREKAALLARMCDELEEANERIRQLEDALAPEGMIPLSFRLTASERRVLAALYRREICTKDMLHLASSKGEHPETGLKIVDVYICKLRRKLKPHGLGIETIWGQGYRLATGTREEIARLRAEEMADSGLLEAAA